MKPFRKQRRINYILAHLCVCAGACVCVCYSLATKIFGRIYADIDSLKCNIVSRLFVHACVPIYLHFNSSATPPSPEDTLFTLTLIISDIQAN